MVVLVVVEVVHMDQQTQPVNVVTSETETSNTATLSPQGNPGGTWKYNFSKPWSGGGGGGAGGTGQNGAPSKCRWLWWYWCSTSNHHLEILASAATATGGGLGYPGPGGASYWVAGGGAGGWQAIQQELDTGGGPGGPGTSGGGSLCWCK